MNVFQRPLPKMNNTNLKITINSSGSVLELDRAIITAVRGVSNLNIKLCTQNAVDITFLSKCTPIYSTFDRYG